MKKNMSFVTATEAGILVAVKTKLSKDDLDKVENNTELVENLLKDAHTTIIFLEPEIANDFNFCIGSYSSGEVSTEAIRAEEGKMVTVMDHLKDWLKTAPAVEPAKKENKPITAFDMAVADTIKTLKKRFPSSGFCIVGINLKAERIAMAGNIKPETAALILLQNKIAHGDD